MNPANILVDLAFKGSREVLEEKAQELRQKVCSSVSLASKLEEELWTLGRLGGDNHVSLIETMWWITTQHMGLRGCQEHTFMAIEDFHLKVSEAGVRYIEYLENPTKTRQSGLKPKKRKTNPKMFETGGERCPVKFFLLFVSKRPECMRRTGRYYLTPIKDERFRFLSVWYQSSHKGKIQFRK